MWSPPSAHSRSRLSVVWRESLTRKLHSAYLSAGRPYYQLQATQAISDAGERISADAKEVTESMATLTHTVLSSIINTAVDLARLAWLVDARYVGALALYLIVSESCREFFIPALERGRLMAAVTATRGRYRRAQSVLLRNPQGVASAETVEELTQYLTDDFQLYGAAMRAFLGALEEAKRATGRDLLCTNNTMVSRPYAQRGYRP